MLMLLCCTIDLPDQLQAVSMRYVLYIVRILRRLKSPARNGRECDNFWTWRKEYRPQRSIMLGLVANHCYWASNVDGRWNKLPAVHVERPVVCKGAASDRRHMSVTFQINTGLPMKSRASRSHFEKGINSRCTPSNNSSDNHSSISEHVIVSL